MKLTSRPEKAIGAGSFFDDLTLEEATLLAALIYRVRLGRGSNVSVFTNAAYDLSTKLDEVLETTFDIDNPVDYVFAVVDMSFSVMDMNCNEIERLSGDNIDIIV